MDISIKNSGNAIPPVSHCLVINKIDGRLVTKFHHKPLQVRLNFFIVPEHSETEIEMICVVTCKMIFISIYCVKKFSPLCNQWIFIS